MQPMLVIDHRDTIRNVFSHAGLDASDAATTDTKIRIGDDVAASASSLPLFDRLTGIAHGHARRLR
jgi:tagatose-1,6-bisphosphate aldolase